MSELFCEACLSGDLEAASAIPPADLLSLHPRKTSLLRDICIIGDVEMARFLAERLALTKEDIISGGIARVCNIAMLRWLIRHFEINENDTKLKISALNSACAKNDLRVAEFVVSTLNVTRTEAYEAFDYSHEIPVLKWLIERFKMHYKRVWDAICLTGKVSFVEWAHEYFISQSRPCNIREFIIKNKLIAELCDSDCNKVAVHIVSKFDIPLRYVPRMVLDDRKSASLWRREYSSDDLEALEGSSCSSGSSEESSEESDEESDEELGPKSAAKLT